MLFIPLNTPSQESVTYNPRLHLYRNACEEVLLINQLLPDAHSIPDNVWS